MPCLSCKRIIDTGTEGFVTIDFGVVRIRKDTGDPATLKWEALKEHEEKDLMPFLFVTARWDDETLSKPGRGQVATSVRFTSPHNSQMCLMFCSMECLCKWVTDQQQHLETPPPELAIEPGPVRIYEP